MPWLAAREISRIDTTYTSELGAFLWTWILRVDGEVQYRLSHVDGRRERNPWQTVRRLNTSELRAVKSGGTAAVSLLSHLAREHGHFPVDHG